MNKTASKKLITCFLCIATMFFAVCFSACGNDGECSHEWNDGTVTQEATCTQEGNVVYKCSLCGETKTETIEKTSHTYAEEWTADGTGHYHICTICGETDEIADHTFEDAEVLQTATETQNGVMGTVCTVCGYEGTREIPALSHTASYDWASDESYHWQACTEHDDCSIIFNRGVHTWNEGEVTKAATCTEKGEILYTCTACGATRYEDLATSEHSYVYANGTWEWNGVISAVYTISCEDCGETKDYDAAITSEITTAATADDDGVMTYTATVTIDGVAYTDETTETIPATGHNYDYGGGAWTWNGYSSATYTVKCSDSGCTETVDYAADITNKIKTAATTNASGIIVYTATVSIGGIEYTDSVEQSYSLLSADFAQDFSTTSSTGTWSYGTVSYSWDSNNQLTYSNGSESFSFTAASDLNSGGDGWISGNSEIKAGWINVGEMTGISYTASKEMVAAVDLTYTGNADDTALSLRIAVVSSDGTTISFVSNAKDCTYSTTLELKAGDTIYFIFNNEGSGYPQADLSISINELSVISDFAADFSTTSSTETWSYGTVSYSWDSNNQLTYSNGSESFSFAAASELNGGGDGWISESSEIKAGWINAGSMTGISYTASEDMTAAVMLSYTGSAADTALSLRVAVVSSDGTTISFICNANSYDYSTTLELKTGDTIYFIFNNEGSGYPQADLSITIYEAVS